uniref:Uncharacterized protein n=1 Tax=Physcomitrium patens TaxID=3218 RepID=A0A2K1JEA7_PHYPA|nr:hypothetical protein PHYPA_020147 [Physcomitrium patens]
MARPEVCSLAMSLFRYVTICRLEIPCALLRTFDGSLSNPVGPCDYPRSKTSNLAQKFKVSSNLRGM